MLANTPARALFKDLLGQANHFLLTILVGLEAVRDPRTTCPPGLSKSWNPRDRDESAIRSRHYALNGALLSACDAMDAYLRLLNRTPKIIESADLARRLEAAGSAHLGERIQVVADYVDDKDILIPAALTRFAVFWRNRLAHFVSSASVAPEIRQALIDNESDIAAEYQGLSVQKMLERFDRKTVPGSPSFKEAAAFTRAAQTYVERVDARMLQEVDCRRFYLESLRAVLEGRKGQAADIWGKDQKRRTVKLIRLAQQFGFCEQTDRLVAARLPIAFLRELPRSVLMPDV